MKNKLAVLDGVSLVALVVAMCSQVDVRHLGRDTLAEGLGYATKTFAIALSDVVFLAVVLWFVARTVQTRSWKRLWWPPLPCFALIFALLLSLFHSHPVVGAVAASIAKNGFGPRSFITDGSKEAIAEIVQWSAYFLVAPWIFVNLLWDRREDLVDRRRLALGAFSLAVLMSCVAAIVELQTFTKSAPSGLFFSKVPAPNVYAAFIAVSLPLLLENESDNMSTQIRFWIVALAVTIIGLATIASPFAFIAAALGLVMASVARGGGTKVRAFRLAMVAGLVLVCVFLWDKSSALLPYRAEQTRLASDNQKVKKQFVEWGAALGWSAPRARSFATGVGPGNYQHNIGPFYNSLPNEEKMPPDSNNLYLVQGVSIGILGLGALLWTVCYFWALAWRAARQNSANWLAAGAVGALSSWFFVNAFHALIVRGAGLVLAFLFALCVVASQGDASEKLNATSDRHN